MKLGKLWIKFNYILHNYYRDHKYMVYLPILIVLGLVMGIISGINSNCEITNFIDNCLNDESNIGSGFMREFFTILITMGFIITITLGKYWHILAMVGLIIFGYKCGYLITCIVKCGGLYSIIHILIITIPYFICTSILIVFFYSFITGYSNLS